MSDDIQNNGQFLVGQWRKGINRTGPEVRAILEARGQKMDSRPTSTVGSIHEKDIARKVGMRGGVVAGVIHLDLFPPLMIKVFGQKWFENGSLSMFYTYATLHEEELRAVVQVPPQNGEDVQVEARLEAKDNKLVARGTVSVGNPKENSYLRAMEITSNPREERRIYKNLEVGYEPPPEEVLISAAELKEGAEFREDSIEWNLGPSPWGNPIVPPSITFRIMRVTPPFLPQGVGFYGATELRYHKGPVKADVTYEKRGKIIAVGVTSKTEYYWFDSWLYEKKSGDLIAEIRHMTRNMKAGSPLYPEL
ncbi:MAG: hypothetical protein HY787_28435 [Deltaproteobacteria bacterium]|nr:hypothetical protein [Deltaproteobacteria bacterium]